mmetsp:Transcript_99903/g.172263  ORF Transcript_99903/g.172263 Transcript_99903/m.172263 type:complete len:81 (-) Transcript_99903:936-1178(-)
MPVLFCSPSPQTPPKTKFRPKCTVEWSNASISSDSLRPGMMPPPLCHPDMCNQQGPNSPSIMGIWDYLQSFCVKSRAFDS